MHHARDVLGVDPSPENEQLLEALGIVPDNQAARLLAGVAERRPTECTPELVKRRLSAAAEHVERYERRVGPARKLTSWIDYRLFRKLSVDDRRAMEEGLQAGTRVADRRRRGGASPAEIRRAEAALEWPMRYLAGHDDERAVLSLWLWTEARNQAWEHWCRGTGVSKGTANRRRARAFEIIAAGLRADAVAPE